MAEEIDKPLAVDVDIDPDFEPQKRPRSCTWPLPRPESNAGKAETADVGIIPEEEVDENGTDDDAQASSGITGASKPVSVIEGNQAVAPAIETNAAVSDKDSYGSPLSSQHALPACNDSSINGLIPQQPRKSSARRNAWGNYSYADLITQAIESSPEKRLTLAQIYDWMVRNVPYFKDKGDSNSSAGWKVRQVKETGCFLTLSCFTCILGTVCVLKIRFVAGNRVNSVSLGHLNSKKCPSLLEFTPILVLIFLQGATRMLEMCGLLIKCMVLWSCQRALQQINCGKCP